MKLLYPLGLLGLIGIPILILIYIIKNRYQEKKIGSTYLWTLSEKFMKKKNPLTQINGLLSLILQLVIIIVMSLAISHPIFSIPGDAENIVYVIDASGSMNMKAEGVTRFNYAKEKIKDDINDAVDGSKFTLIYAGSTAETVISENNSKEKVIKALDKLTVTTLPCKIEDAIDIAQNMYDENKALNIKVYSDKDYDSTENLEYFDCYRNEKNISVLSLDSTSAEDGITFTSSVCSYSDDASFKAELYVDDKLISSQDVSTVKDEKKTLTFTTDILSFSKAECRITADDDSLSQDDSYILYEKGEEDTSSVLLISDQPFYLYSALTAADTEVTVLYSDEYTGEEFGYDIYVFDGIVPKSTPSDGSIWYVGEQENIQDSGFTMQELIELDSAGYLSYEKSDDATYARITENTMNSSIAVGSYFKYSLVDDFTQILSIDSTPMLFVRTMSDNYKEVVFSFDIHKSNFPVLFDFPVLISNLISYSSPQAIQELSYSCGDLLTVEKMPNSKSTEILSPSGVSTFTDSSLSTDSKVLTETGTYKLTVNFENESREYLFFVHFPFAESIPYEEAESLSLQGEKEEHNLDGEYDNLLIVIIAVFAIMAIDWGVYLYEQHQLC